MGIKNCHDSLFHASEKIVLDNLLGTELLTSQNLYNIHPDLTYMKTICQGPGQLCI